MNNDQREKLGYEVLNWLQATERLRQLQPFVPEKLKADVHTMAGKLLDAFQRKERDPIHHVLQADHGVYDFKGKDTN